MLAIRTSGPDVKRSGGGSTTEVILKLDHLDRAALIFHELTLPDLTALSQFDSAVDVDFPVSDLVLGLAAIFSEICDLQEITEGDEFTALEFKFFHESIVSESFLIGPIYL